MGHQPMVLVWCAPPCAPTTTPNPPKRDTGGAGGLPVRAVSASQACGALVPPARAGRAKYQVKRRGQSPPLLAHCARPPMLSMAHQPSEPAKTTLKHPPHNPSLSKTNAKCPPNGREGVDRRRASWRLGEENGVVRHLNTIRTCYKAWNITNILFKTACKQN